MKDKKERIRHLISLLNDASRSYYQEADEIMSNEEYDRLYDELLNLEKDTGIVFSNSPTQNVGYEVVSGLPKEEHQSPMLSLDKTKDKEALEAWLGSQKGILSWKLDGLTVVLTYEEGHLVKGLTRGNGMVGEVITPNVRAFQNVPINISYKGRLVVRGEAVISYEDFAKINDSLPEGEEPYKNPRNLCSGAVRQLNSGITAKRQVNFMAFSMNDIEDVDFSNSHEKQLKWLQQQGFDVVEYVIVEPTTVSAAIEDFKAKIQENPYPSDGLVLLMDDIKYGQSLGATSKFPRNSMAFKWADEQQETILQEILWSPSRTGLINPIAIFDPVSLEGTTVSRASLHNVSIFQKLSLGAGDRIKVYKANMIIPQVSENMTPGEADPLPSTCPACNMPVRLQDENGVKTLWCDNDQCPAKKIKSYALLVSRDALNVDGLSEERIKKLIEEGLIHSKADIFRLADHKEEIIKMEGFGEKSYNKLISAIEDARTTTLDRFIYSLGIEGFGRATAKLVSAFVDNRLERIYELNEAQLATIDGIGMVLAKSFTSFFNDDIKNMEARELARELVIKVPSTGETFLKGITFVITGSLESFNNRDELKEAIEKAGGKVASSVSNNTDFLINNDITSASGKNKKAKSLGVPIIDEKTILAALANKSKPQ